MKKIALGFLLLSTGCRTWALKDDYAWTAQISTNSVNRGEDLRFRVEARDKAGNPAPGVSYLWSVDWVGLNGSRHKGKTFEEENIRSKGAAGQAYLRVYAYDAGGAVTQVLKEPFQVN